MVMSHYPFGGAWDQKKNLQMVILREIPKLKVHFLGW